MELGGVRGLSPGPPPQIRVHAVSREGPDPGTRHSWKRSRAALPGERDELLLQEMKLLINPQAGAGKVKTPSLKGA